MQPETGSWFVKLQYVGKMLNWDALHCTGLYIYMSYKVYFKQHPSPGRKIRSKYGYHSLRNTFKHFSSENSESRENNIHVEPSAALIILPHELEDGTDDHQRGDISQHNLLWTFLSLKSFQFHHFIKSFVYILLLGETFPSLNSHTVMYHRWSFCNISQNHLLSDSTECRIAWFP